MNSTVYPPGPKTGFFGVKQYLDSQRDPLEFIERMSGEYGDIVYFRIGRRHVYLLNHPDHIKGVLVTHYANFVKGRGVVNRRNNFFGEGLLTSEGEFHRRQRQLTQPAFHHGRFFGYGAMMSKITSDISKSSWRAGDKLDVLEMMRHITLHIMSTTLFGTNVGTKHEQVIEAMQVGISRFKTFQPVAARISDRLSLLHRRRLKQARFNIESVVSEIIAERIRADEDQGDLLSLLLTRTNAEDERLTSARQIRDEAVTIFIGGFENVALALTWSWLLLAKHPEAEAKLHRELDDVLGRESRLPTADDFSRLVYTRMVFEEAMRIYPPVPRLVRTAIRDYKVGDFTIPNGALVVVSQYLMHRDERFYPEPERFDPERFAPEAKRERPAFSYFPFGGGARRCIGEGFGIMEGVLVLATLASRWRLRPTSEDPVELIATHFLHPKQAINMTIEKRVPLPMKTDLPTTRKLNADEAESATERACERS